MPAPASLSHKCRSLSAPSIPVDTRHQQPPCIMIWEWKLWERPCGSSLELKKANFQSTYPRWTAWYNTRQHRPRWHKDLTGCLVAFRQHWLHKSIECRLFNILIINFGITWPLHACWIPATIHTHFLMMIMMRHMAFQLGSAVFCYLAQRTYLTLLVATLQSRNQSDMVFVPAPPYSKRSRKKTGAAKPQIVILQFIDCALVKS